jgi:hypothetical protein
VPCVAGPHRTTGEHGGSPAALSGASPPRRTLAARRNPPQSESCPLGATAKTGRGLRFRRLAVSPKNATAAENLPPQRSGPRSDARPLSRGCGWVPAVSDRPYTGPPFQPGEVNWQSVPLVAGLMYPPGTRRRGRVANTGPGRITCGHSVRRCPGRARTTARRTALHRSAASRNGHPGRLPPRRRCRRRSLARERRPGGVLRAARWRDPCLASRAPARGQNAGDHRMTRHTHPCAATAGA